MLVIILLFIFFINNYFLYLFKIFYKNMVVKILSFKLVYYWFIIKKLVIIKSWFIILA